MKHIITIAVMALGLALLCVLSPAAAAQDADLRHAVRADEAFRHEWLQFDTYWVRTFLGKEKANEFRSRVYIHNIDSATQHVAIVGPRKAVLFTYDTVYFIDHFHADKAAYARSTVIPGQNENHYDLMASNDLTYELQYFSMYIHPSLSEHTFNIILPQEEDKYRDLGSHLYVDAIIQQKHCYADHCEMRDDPLHLVYNRELDLFDYGFTIDGGNTFGFRLKNFSYSDASDYLDSLFSFANYPRYQSYPPTVLPTTKCSSSNYLITDTVRSFPLVNLSTGDTVTLASLQGWTLLYFGHFESARYYAAMQHFRRRVDHAVWLMPRSDNAEALRRVADSLHFGNDVYYAKGFDRHLNRDGFYLIAPDHLTAYYTTGPYIPTPRNTLRALLSNKRK